MDAIRDVAHQVGSLTARLFGAPGFFSPNLYGDWLHGCATTSYYDTADQGPTLEHFVGFERGNAGKVRASLGAANVESGNLAYIDNARMHIRPEHVTASGAFPPSFPAIEIDGVRYWDDGLVSNTPVQYVLDTVPRRSTIAFQVDLFPSFGPLPHTSEEVGGRGKDIRISTRIRAGTDAFGKRHDL